MQTDVDALMRLLETKKSGSMKEIAKELGVSEKVVEEWGRYFEEEGLVKISYKFTTPYIELAEEKEKKKEVGFKKEEKRPKPHLTTKPHLKTEIPEEKGTEKGKELTDISDKMQKAQLAVTEGKFLEAKKQYEELYAQFNKIPAVFLEKFGQIEDQLIKLNNELIVKLENKLQKDMNDKQAKILQLLKQGLQHLRRKEFDKANKIYADIKGLYKQLPSGFFKEKIDLTKRVLAFYENLNNMRSKLAVSTLNTKSQLIERQLTVARVALKAHNTDEATMAYSLAKEAYSMLPEGFFESKIALQQRMLQVHQEIVETKKQFSIQDANSKLATIKTLIIEIKELLKKKELITAAQRYSEIRELYSQMPKGFIKNEHLLQNDILKAYKDITTTKNNLALKAIQTGKRKIDSFLAKGKITRKRKDFDLAFQYYRQSVETYNTLPEGFNRTKIEIRNNIYDTYFDLVSHSDMITLGELQGYAKDKYFSLLKLIVNAYEVVEARKFNLLEDVYRSIYLIYQDLPLSLASKKIKLKEGIHNIYQMYKLYKLTEQLQDAELIKDRPAIQSIITDMSGLANHLEETVPNSLPLVNYTKSKLFTYEVKATQPDKLLELPLLPKKESRTETLMKKAMNYLAIRNYPKALAYVNQILKLEPQNQTARGMLDEIQKERKGKGLITPSKADKHIALAVTSLEDLDYATAVKHAEEALKLEPKNQDAYLILQKAKSAQRMR